MIYSDYMKHIIRALQGGALSPAEADVIKQHVDARTRRSAA